MRIGLASDSFGNLEPLERALDLFARAKVDRMYFLGGRLADLDAVLVRRRGVACEAPVPTTDAEFLAAVQGALSRHAGGAEDAFPARIVRVASRACPEYASGAASRKQMDMIEGRICCLVHDKAELTREDITNATVLFHGNSAVAALVQIGPRVFVTPGHLRAPAPEGRPPTCAILEVGQREVALSVFSPQGQLLREVRGAFAVGGKMSVR